MRLGIAVVLLMVLSGCLGPGAQPTQQNADTVIIKNFAFDPPSLTVTAGTTVTWTNEDPATHTIKSDTFNSQELGRGGSFKSTFSTPGTYDYTCGIHPSMKGRIIVE